MGLRLARLAHLRIACPVLALLTNKQEAMEEEPDYVQEYMAVEIVPDTGELITPPAPVAVLEQSYADVSLLAGMLVDKFRYHLPLYRQHQRMKASGITVSRASLTSWVR